MTDLLINLKMAGDQVVIGGLRQVGAAAVNFLGQAAGVALDFAKDSFKGAIEAQAGMDKLSASITRMGDAAPVSMAGALGLADQFKNLVGGSDDVVLAMTDIGLKFDTIGKDTFPRFIESSADLAARLGIDAPRAAEILGKTLQDFSTDGAGALGRLKAAGVTLTDQQEEQIKKMIEAGDAAGAQKLLLDALAETTGGAAAAAAGTFAGQMAIFQETVADAGEGVALALLPALTALAADVLPQLTPIITEVAAAATTFITGQLIPAFLQAVEWIKANWPAIQATIAEVWAAAQPILQAAGDFITGTLIPMFQQMVDWVITNWPTIQATIAQVMTEIQTVITTITATVQAIWSEWGDEIVAVIDFFVSQYNIIFSAFKAAFEGDWRKFGEILRTAWDDAWKNIQAIAQAAMDWFTTQDWGAIGSDIVQGIADGITAGAQWIADAAAAAARAAVDAAKGFLGIHSPSRVFAGIGGNMMAGMAQGIDSAAYMPSQAAVSAAGAVVMNVGGISINGAGNPSATAAAVRTELDRMGRRTDTRLRTR